MSALRVVVGLFNTFQPFLPAMRAARRGTLAGIASVAVTHRAG